MEKCKLLIPAQNKKSVEAMVGYADECYFGVSTFNMRMHARNISKNDMKDMVDFCHDNNITAILTSNVLIYENELNSLHNLLENAVTSEIDAVIVHDFAALEICKELGIPFHISTQCNVSNSVSANFYEDQGAERIVFARELSLKQISEIIPKLKKAKAEAFIHGAMCTSISGRCYFSQTICQDSEFSANRGKCLQPCRNEWTVVHRDGNEFDYDGKFFINAKDLCMIEYIPELINAGIYAFKVEGRMRSPRYIETVARIYRTAIDEYYEGTFSKEKAMEWKRELSQVYNRGFSTGFYFNKPIATDVNRTFSGNMSSKRKYEVGRVITYYRKKMVAKVLLRSGKFKIGDVIYFEGGDLGNFYRHEIIEMFHKNKPIQETPDISKIKNEYLVTMKLLKPVSKNDKIYIYIDKK